MNENEVDVLECLYRWWRLHKLSMITMTDLQRRLANDGLSTDAHAALASLTTNGWIARLPPDVVMLTEAGLAEGLRRNL